MHITIDLSLRLVRCNRVWLSIMFVISLEHTELELGHQLLLICRWLSNNNTDEYDGARPQKTNHAKQEKQKQNDNNKKTIMRLLHTYIHTYVFMYICADDNAPFVLPLVDSKAVSGFAFVLNSAVLHFCSHSRMALSLALSLSISLSHFERMLRERA